VGDGIIIIRGRALMAAAVVLLFKGRYYLLWMRLIIILDDVIKSIVWNDRLTMASVGAAGRGRFPQAAVDVVLMVFLKRRFNGGNDVVAMSAVRRG